MYDVEQYDVIVIGGGITGLGTARDCALRGLKVLLVERDDIASGASGRNHGLLHSGARYAVNDPESARECIRENKILKKIAPHCIEKTGGLFITLPEDEDEGYGLEYQKIFIDACKTSGIDAEAIDPVDALRMEPSVNPALMGAVKVPDGAVDPFKLCSANMYDALLHGTTILPYTEVTSVIREGCSVTGIETRNTHTGERASYRASVTVNAAGIWGHGIARMAGVKIEMCPTKGSLLIFAHRLNNVVINRCRKSSDGDILVPGDTVSVIGTTSTGISYDECDELNVTAEEVCTLMREGARLCPSITHTRVLRAYAGVRPLIKSAEDATGRNISRGIVCLDHSERDGLEGFITITGGKLMTYRLMAEIATDAVCRKLGVSVTCRTRLAMLSDPLVPRHSESATDELICECERVTFDDVKWAVNHLGVQNLEDLRRRTRLGMGTCQGTKCIALAAKALARAKGNPEETRELVHRFVEERWKGMTSVGWGDNLREMEYMQKIWKGKYAETTEK